MTKSGSMRTTATVFIILSSIMLTTSSCRKSDRDMDTTTMGIHDGVLGQELISDLIFLVQDLAVSDTMTSTGGGNYSPPACLSITHNPATGGFPVTVTYNFGNGCLCTDGRFRSGMFTAEYSGYYGDSLTDIKITFQDYHCDSAWYRQGSVDWTCLGTNGHQNKVNKLSVHNMQFLGDSINILYDADQQWEQIAGVATPGITDDKYTVTGTSSGHHSKGNYFETVTDSTGFNCAPSCTWPFGGSLTVSPANLATRYLVFGSSCSNTATASINSIEYSVNLPELRGN